MVPSLKLSPPSWTRKPTIGLPLSMGLLKTDEKHLGNLFQGGYGSIIFILFCHTINTS